MTLRIVKAVPSYKNSYQKTKIGGLLRSTLDLFVTFCCQKWPVSWLKVLWTHSTINSSENTTENLIKTVHKLQLQFNQFISSVRFVRSFCSFVRCFVYIGRWHQWNDFVRCVSYFTLSYPLFIVIYSKLVHSIPTKTSQKRKKVRLAKYQPPFCRTSFQTVWLRKEKKNWTIYCQKNRTSELCYVRDFVICL